MLRSDADEINITSVAPLAQNLTQQARALVLEANGASALLFRPVVQVMLHSNA